MKKSFSISAKRHIATMVLAIVSFFSVWASDDFNDVVSSVVPVTFTNDAEHPWTVEGNTAIIRGINQSNYYAASWLTMAYATTTTTQLSFEWAFYNYGDHMDLQVFIDGKYLASKSNNTYTRKIFILEPGEHIIAFRDSVGYRNYTGNWSSVRNIVIEEYKTLESTVLTDNSEPLTFETGGEYPWTTEDGYIQSSNYGTANSSSKFSTTFTIDKLSKFSFDRRVGYWNGSNYTSDNSSYHYFSFKINGEQYRGNTYATSFSTINVALLPGTYTMEWSDTIYNITSMLLSQVRNVELSSNWVDVELASAGSLGVEVLYLVDVLTDVELLKVKGPINSTDWANIKQMTNLIALDLSDATFEAIPDKAFDGQSNLSYIKLPEGVKSIGEYAFRGTPLMNINLPSTLTSIGQYAFNNCAYLKELVMPNTVTTVGQYAFSGCTVLKKLWFSDLVTTIERYTCSECNQLTDLHLPSNLSNILRAAFYNNSNLHHIDLPKSLNKIFYQAFYNCAIDSVKLPVTLSYLAEYAFQNCFNLKYIELPSYLESTSEYDGGTRYYGYCYNFYNCDAVETIVMRAATPPSVTYDPFQDGRAKSAITLKVPSFAVVNYKLDNYWYQFGSIVEGDDVDYWKLSSALSLTNNRRMQGKPDIDLYYGGQLTVGGNAPMESGLFRVFVNETNPGRLLNTCEAMTADSITTNFSVNANTWYFFTPLHDVDLTKVSVSNGASYVFRYYDGSSRASNGTGSSWRNIDDYILRAGQGYIFHCNANAVITMPADAANHSQVFRTTDYTRPLATYEAVASANKSWNFVGNPYPCYYDIYYMDFTAPITVWTGNTYKAYSIVDDDYTLRPMQAFFVQKPDAVDNIIFRKEGRQLTSEIAHRASARIFRAPSQKNRYLFNLQLKADEKIDETRVVLNNEASLGYEIECDASKFMSFDSAMPQIFTLDRQGNSYAINERPMDDGKIKLAYYVGQSDYYTITANRADGQIYLYDNQTNKTVNLMEQDYTFHSDATNGTNDTRFVLTLNIGDETGLNEVETKQDNGIIYDLQGRRVQNVTKGIFIQNGQKVVRQ